MIIGLSMHQRYNFYFKGTNPIQDMLRNGKSMVCLNSLVTRSDHLGQNGHNLKHYLSCTLYL